MLASLVSWLKLPSFGTISMAMRCHVTSQRGTAVQHEPRSFVVGPAVASFRRDLAQGSIDRALVALAVPIVFANLLQMAYQLIDTFRVGCLYAAAVAAVSLSFP